MQVYRNFTDNELGRLLGKGDAAAYTEIYNRFKGILYLHAYRMLQDDEEAKDVVQDLFAALWVKRTYLVFKKGLQVYLYTAVRNRVFDRISRKKVESHYFESLKDFAPGVGPATDEGLHEKELAALIEKEISALPVKMRRMFELSRKASLSYREIAEQLNVSDKTVKKQISNALKILRLKTGTISCFLSTTTTLLSRLLQ